MPTVNLFIAGVAALAVVVGLAGLVLYLRDRFVRSQGRSVQQVQARLAALLQFYSTLRWGIPGALAIIFGIFFAIDRSREHESDWWIGLFFIPAGWILVRLLAGRSWRRYLELQRQSERGDGQSGGA